MSANNESSQTPRTTLTIHGKAYVLDAADARAIRHALLHYLDSSDQVARVPFLTPEHEAWIREADEAWFDEEGRLHAGLWTWQSGGDQPALVYRPQPSTRVGYSYVAYLLYEQRKWSVTSITFEKIYYR